MLRIRNSLAAIVGIAGVSLVFASCHVEDPSDREVENFDTVHTTMASTAGGAAAAGATARMPVQQVSGVVPVEDWATTQTRIAQLADSADRMLRKVPNLTRWEQVKLRRDVNLMQISKARELGIVPGSNVDELVKSGKLVMLENNTRYWNLHNLNYSIPYVTPSAEELIVQIAERFQAKLDSLDVPRYRLVITSALRTADKQAALRRANSNASKIESAHEFGTTVDIAYRRFAAPIDSTLNGNGVMLSDSVMGKAANVRSAELQAILGRVLQDLNAEGKVMVMMERHQTVYHITVAQQLPRPRQVPAI